MRHAIKITLIALSATFTATLLIAVTAAYFQGLFDAPDLLRLRDERQVSIMYDGDGQELKWFCRDFCREPISLKEITSDMQKFAIAAEDKDFGSRPLAVDLTRIVKAAWKNYRAKRIKQGASTIEMQLAQTIFGRDEMLMRRHPGNTLLEWERKIRQTVIATWLDAKLDRAQILELYLNNIYCGDNFYGVGLCSKYWFGKELSGLDSCDKALLIGLWRKPSASPFTKKDAAHALRSRVLEQLFGQGLINAGEKNACNSAPLPERIEKGNPAPHFVEYVRKQITSQRLLVDQGLRIYTTVNTRIQTETNRALEEVMNAMKSRNPALAHDLWGAALMLDRRNGRIVVWSAAPSFRENQFDPIYHGRPIGSAAKPFFIYAWLHKGGRLTCQDEGTGPCRLDDSYETFSGKSSVYIPMGGRKRHYLQNFPYLRLRRYIGMADPLLCVAESRNVCVMSGVDGIGGSRARRFTVAKEYEGKSGEKKTITIPELVRKEEILEAMMRLGITLPTIDPSFIKDLGINLVDPLWARRVGLPFNTIDPGLTVAIGSIDVSLLQMTRAFTAFSGGLVEPFAIEEIFGPGDKLLYRATPKEPEQVLEEKEILGMIRALRATVEFPNGTGRLARDGKGGLNFPVAGKTGTAANWMGDTTDNWFVGCSPSYCMGVWIGRKHQLAMKNTTGPNGEMIQETGGRNSLRVFIAAMRAVHEGKPKETFPESTDPLQPFRPSRPQPNAETADYDFQTDSF